MFTRSEYMAAPRAESKAAHRRYYAQFVSPSVIARVVGAIGADKLRESVDPSFNDISLHSWDAIALNLGPLAISFNSVGDYASLGSLVCVAKEAARQYLEGK
jgi:hypothetical protein